MKKELTIENINTGNLLGVALKRLRKQRELSQEELARGIGIRQATVSDIENGRGGSLETFFKIIQYLQGNMVLSSERTVVGKKVDKVSRAAEILNMMKDD